MSVFSSCEGGEGKGGKDKEGQEGREGKGKGKGKGEGVVVRARVKAREAAQVQVSSTSSPACAYIVPSLNPRPSCQSPFERDLASLDFDLASMDVGRLGLVGLQLGC